MLARLGYRAPDVWSEFARLSREMDQLFGDTRAVSKAGVFPSLNLYDDGNHLIVRAEMPGVDTKDLEVDATAKVLTISGERKRPGFEERASFHRQEREYGTFSRSISLPEDIDPDKVKATYKLGVLELTLPKAEAAKPRKIKIKS